MTWPLWRVQIKDALRTALHDLDVPAADTATQDGTDA